MLGKLRPVGSRVPLPETTDTDLSFPWSRKYVTEFMESGTEALSLAIALAVDRQRSIANPEVILPAYGCPDLAAAALAQGVKPVLVDLLKDTPYLDEQKLCEAITANCVAVVGVGLLGIPERLNLLSAVCKEKGLFLIEDSAQCFPPSGSDEELVDAIVLSFSRGKPINLMGGGALIYRRELNPEAGMVVERVPVVERSIGFWWRIKRLIFHLLMARIPYWLVEKMPFLHIGETHFRACRSICRLDIPKELLLAGIRTFQTRPSLEVAFEQEMGFLENFGWRILSRNQGKDRDQQNVAPRVRFAMLAPTGEACREAAVALNNHGIGASNFYGGILPEFEGLEHVFEQGAFPVAKDFSSRLLTLPSHEDVHLHDIQVIASVMRKLVDHHPQI